MSTPSGYDVVPHHDMGAPLAMWPLYRKTAKDNTGTKKKAALEPCATSVDDVIAYMI